MGEFKFFKFTSARYKHNGIDILEVIHSSRNGTIQAVDLEFKQYFTDLIVITAIFHAYEEQRVKSDLFSFNRISRVLNKAILRVGKVALSN